MECRHCRRYFRDNPDNLGARCPSCRMPLYERAEPTQSPVTQDMPTCAVHPNRAAITTCRRCQTPLCHLCRTRWQEESLCVSCVEKTLATPDNPAGDPRIHRRQAFWSLVLGLAGWALLLAGGLPMVLFGSLKKELATMALLVVLLSFVPALFALGQGAAAVRARGDRLRLATTGLTLSGAQIGLTLGVLLLVVWAN